ncbi:TM0106 family RecB-like putative nuclease [Dyadobacter endophyticus]|uniref:TM0106 family RecB-like putative nuclease n=1 Tax=Dyadobacter endophyticus TaxID=1749036 RepID=UPI003CE7FD27
MRKFQGEMIYSPSDLIRYLASPFASWMDRYYLEHPDLVKPDAETEDQVLIARTGDEHEQAVLAELEFSGKTIAKIDGKNLSDAIIQTKDAIAKRVSIVYQGALQDDRFAGYSDFLILDEGGFYQLWDTKLARSPKPYYAIQLCCYAEMYAATSGEPAPEKFGIILGNGLKVEFRTEDFFHYYRKIRANFLEMQDGFTGQISERPERLPGADHGRWTSYAESYFSETDHLVQVAGITSGQIKKLRKAGICTMEQLGLASGSNIPKLAADTLEKLSGQARLQCQTRVDRLLDPEAPAQYELITKPADVLIPSGLENIPPKDQADIFFDMEGYPLALGGLEYLFGASTYEREFFDWWGHTRDEEKRAFEGFIDWVYNRWKKNPQMHIYHYAAYEESALKRLSTRHDTRQEEVDDLLRNGVLVDLYKVVKQGLRIGESSYSIKFVEHLYRPKRSTTVATAVDSIVQYARWIESGQSKDWNISSILKGIRDYNEDDCLSTEELLQWLRGVALQHQISPVAKSKVIENDQQTILSQEVQDRLNLIKQLREKGDSVSIILGDLIDFHRREQKPMWWRMFERAEAELEELRDDAACIHNIIATGDPVADKQSFIQDYVFDPSQECKLKDGDVVRFCHNLIAPFSISRLDLNGGGLSLRISQRKLNEESNGGFPQLGSLLPYEFVSTKEIQNALTNIGQKHLSAELPNTILALLSRVPPDTALQQVYEDTIEAATRVTLEMSGSCLTIQGPPGTGKTYTASQVIIALLSAGKKVGVASNSHKAVVNLLCECGKLMRMEGLSLHGIKAGGEGEGELFTDNPDIKYIKEGKNAAASFQGGVIGGTAWLFSRPEWENNLDYLFIDEAGQVSLANAVAMARSARNLVLLGDQMQLEQPIQGTHPGDSGMSCLQYVLKDESLSMPDAPVYHAIVPAEMGLFLGESRRMHPEVCKFISDSIYEGRLTSHIECENQKIENDPSATLISKENGIVFLGVEHDGNTQQSNEEAEKVLAVYQELLGNAFTASDGSVRPLTLEDFLFITPYNAQVRTLKAILPLGARVGSVDKFQGQEAAVCILSLCSSYGEYGSRGLSFILDKNRLNVAISRARCLAVVVADPRIAQTPTHSLSEMTLLNLFCKLNFIA